ncbi:MAG: 6-pyruvoyl-tetrahydropterin synthase-related protein [Lysobacterales bacterium]
MTHPKGSDTPDEGRATSQAGRNSRAAGAQPQRPNVIALLIVIVASVSAMLPLLLQPGLVRYFDWPLHLFWQQAFHDALSQGIAYPRWLATVNGHWGAPVFVFYPPLAYFVGALGVSVFGSAVAGLKLVFAAASVGVGVSSWVLLRAHALRWIAVMAAIAMALSPQVLALGYRFNMPGAALALVFVPWVLAPLFTDISSTQRRVLGVAVPFALVIASHLPTALQVGALACVIALVRSILSRELRIWKVVSLGTIFGALLSAIYLLPALAELGTVHADALLSGRTDIAFNLLYRSGTEGRPQFHSDYGFFEWVNAVLAGAMVMCVANAARGGVRDEKFRRVALPAAVAALLAFFLSTQWALPVYEWVRPLRFVQFGWRWQPLFLMLAVVAMVASHACAIPRTSRKTPSGIVIAVICVGLAASSLPLITLGGWAGLRSLERTDARDIAWALTRLQHDTLEHRPRAMGEYWQARLADDFTPTALVIEGIGNIEPTGETHHFRSWRVDATTPLKLRLKTLCFPGWQASIDGLPTHHACDEKGGVIVSLPQGSVDLQLEFRSTSSRRSGAMISLAALLIALWLAHRTRLRPR